MQRGQRSPRATDEHEAYSTALHAHVHAFFSKHELTTLERSTRARFVQSHPAFTPSRWRPARSFICDICFGGRGLIEKPHATPMEFVLVAPESSARHVELLTMTAYYHATETLEHGHTFPIGQPWLPGSSLDHMLVCRPYPFAPDFELFASDGAHVNLSWLLPITEAERDFKVRRGLEELECRFDEARIQYWNPSRMVVVEADDA